eukprot:NODE_3909_length_1143_cov_19.492157_g3719_i0.p1 GENE.NODE_3909_length_1143_cov_19.492157_g3719_i0~~NODE_3909_length_1143_cov_19.492157_g3719_i0.p1  ORF type:complete len:266 (+),score=18.89 NODE_3909_length_1143_cov_19.492157_g3719_i0:339-1136(+)
MGAMKKALDLYRPLMQAVFDAEGWPPLNPVNTLLVVSGPQKCHVCQVGFTNLWVHRGTCYGCEGRLRASGRCPYSSKCPPASFCPHHRKCCTCDASCCDDCRLMQGTGEDCLALAQKIDPKAIFLDFDRTVATTKAGGNPLQGDHSIDPDLYALMYLYPNVHIVTRNSHKEGIEQFLASKGVPSTVKVHSAKLEGCRKADIMARFCDLDCTALFIDDDIRELVDPAIVQLGPQLWRVQFVRTRQNSAPAKVSASAVDANKSTTPQ